MHRYHHLEGESRHVMLEQGTEPPGSGDENDEVGIYLCKQCDAPLYLSSSKFQSGCGWPSFDDEMPGAIDRKNDGDRTEIVCARCHGHLGHVFVGEHLTSKNVRHCVNSVSMTFMPAIVDGYERAFFGGGCFWGVEKEMKAFAHSTEVGYMGGHFVNPTYDDVCSGKTGHTEVVEVFFKPGEFEKVALGFLKVHKPDQAKDQYRSVIFYLTLEQKKIAERVANSIYIEPASYFYRAENYHQNYIS